MNPRDKRGMGGAPVPSTMVPNRRLREQLERAEREPRRSSIEDEQTRVPLEDPVGSAPMPHEAMGIDSGEIEIQEEPSEAFQLRRDDTEETPMPRPKAAPRRPAPIAAKTVRDRHGWEDEETRIDPAAAAGETMEISEMMEVYEVGDSFGAGNSAETR